MEKGETGPDAAVALLAGLMGLGGVTAALLDGNPPSIYGVPRWAQVAMLNSGFFGSDAPPHTREVLGGRCTGTPAAACPGHLNCPKGWEPPGLH